eukprot:scaffold103034_cov67-Phaeocystis_antarctica.AAC.1
MVHPLAIAILAGLVNQALVPTALSRPVDLDEAAKTNTDLFAGLAGRSMQDAWVCRRLGLVDL